VGVSELRLERTSGAWHVTATVITPATDVLGLRLSATDAPSPEGAQDLAEVVLADGPRRVKSWNPS
jgi:hypothetical protein